MGDFSGLTATGAPAFASCPILLGEIVSFPAFGFSKGFALGKRATLPARFLFILGDFDFDRDLEDLSFPRLNLSGVFVRLLGDAWDRSVVFFFSLYGPAPTFVSVPCLFRLCVCCVCVYI